MFSEKEEEEMLRIDQRLKELIARHYRKKGVHHIRPEHITTEFKADKRQEMLYGYLRRPKVDEVDLKKSRKKPSLFKRLLATFR